MKNSGLADSPFFSAPGIETDAAPASDLHSGKEMKEKPYENMQKKKARTIPSNRDTTAPRDHDTAVSRRHETKVSRYPATAVEKIRKAVKEFGKEAATHRFTRAEKQIVADLIYTYNRNNGIRTSENEIARIAINFILHDYAENAEASILDRVLKALNK